jgi:hypothetical protein
VSLRTFPISTKALKTLAYNRICFTFYFFFFSYTFFLTLLLRSTFKGPRPLVLALCYTPLAGRS